MKAIKTTLVYGFLGAGKTAYIQDSIFHDFFHKRGSTLVLSFEAGEGEYDEAGLSAFRTHVAHYEGGETITAFCLRSVQACAPDRVFVEMNGMRNDIRESLPDALKVVFSTMLIDGGTLPLYLANMRQIMQDMVRACDLITFNRCPDKSALAEYGRLFKLMNRRATYYWEGPGGYHEKAFDDFVPFDLESDDIRIDAGDFVPFVLDAAEHPAHYAGKTVSLSGQLRDGKLGRTVMTCCMADLQFLGVACEGAALPDQGWVEILGRGTLSEGPYGREQLTLRVSECHPIDPPPQWILSGGG